MNTLQKAIANLKEMMKNVIFIQKPIDLTNSTDVTTTMSAIVDASSLSSGDKQMQEAFVQNRQDIVADDDDLVDILNTLWKAGASTVRRPPARRRHTQITISHRSNSHWKI